MKTASGGKIRSAAFSALVLAWSGTVFFLFLRQVIHYFGPDLPRLPGAFSHDFNRPLAAAWLGHLAKTAGAALFMLTSWSLGRQAFAGLRLFRSEAWETERSLGPEMAWFLETAAGIVVWMLLGFALAALGACRPADLRLASSGLALEAALWTWIRRPRAARSRPPRMPFSPGAVLLACAIGLTYYAATILPETFSDALFYYLSVPKTYLEAGRIVDISGNITSYYPGAAQMVFMWALAWTDERACRLINLFVGLGWSLAACSWTARHWGAKAGRWTLLLMVASPFIGQFMWACTYEMFCGYFVFLSFVLWQAHRSAEDRPDGSLAAFFSGLFLGTAAAVKYTAVFAAPYFAAGFLLQARRSKIRPAAIAAFVLGFLLPLAPWWMRNYAFTGNPFYPYAAWWPGITGPQRELLIQFFSVQRGDLPVWRRALAIADDSLRGVWKGRNGFIGPALLMILPFIPSGFSGTRPEGPEKKTLWKELSFYALSSYAFFFLSTGFLRFFMPHLWAFFALAGIALSHLSERTRLLRRALPALVLAAVLAQWASTMLVFSLYYEGTLVLFGRRSPSEYLKEEHSFTHRNPSDGAYEFLRRFARSSSGKVYILGEPCVYRCPLPFYTNWRYDVPLYARAFQRGEAPEKFLEGLYEEGFRYVLFNKPAFQATTMAAYRGPETLQSLYRMFDRMAPPVYQDRWTFLFRIPPPERP